MSVEAFQIPASKVTQPQKISWETFERHYLEKDGRYKYEWANGELVKTQRTMNQKQQFILFNLEALLATLKKPNIQLGRLLSE